jgi:transcriptional regulator with XRE-family HTH domain
MVGASTARAEGGDAAIELGRLLRTARRLRKLTLRQVASDTGTSETALSLLERGLRPMPVAKLARVVERTGAEASEIFQLAGAVPPSAASDMVGPDLSRVLEGGALSSAARAALRREHLSVIAAGLTAAVEQAPVDVAGLLYSELLIDTEPAEIAAPRFQNEQTAQYPAGLSAAERSADLRFWLAHLAGHALLSPNRLPHCPERDATEGEANYLAAAILVPRGLLLDEFQFMPVGEYDVAEADGLAGLVGEVAGRFDVPAWLAARRLAEAGLFERADGLEAA